MSARRKPALGMPGAGGVMAVGAQLTVHAVTHSTQDGDRYFLYGACGAEQEWEITAESARLVGESIGRFYEADRRRIQIWADMTSLRLETARRARANAARAAESR